jgi:hypothetical protein
MCGTKRRTSMRKQSRHAKKSTMPMMKTTRRYLAECEGEWKWATIARTSITKVRSAAIGWTIRIVERVARVAVARGKSVGSLIEKPGHHTTVSFTMLGVNRYYDLLTSIVSDFNGAAAAIFAVAKNTELCAIVDAKGHSLDDGSREDGEQEQGEGREEQNRQRRRRSQHCEWKLQKTRPSGVAVVELPAPSRRGRAGGSLDAVGGAARGDDLVGASAIALKYRRGFENSGAGFCRARHAIYRRKKVERISELTTRSTLALNRPVSEKRSSP